MFKVRHLGSLLLTVTAGCAGPGPYPAYSTHPAVPHRDTTAAQRLNQEGLDAVEKDDLEAAEKHFRAALDRDLLYAAAHNNLGLVLLRQGFMYGAAWEFQLACKTAPHAAEPRHNLGLVMERVGRLDEAITDYEAALEIDPDSVEIMGHLARAYIKAHRSDSPELPHLLKTLTLHNPGGSWDRWARSQLLTLDTGD